MPYKAINLNTGDILRSDLFLKSEDIRGKHPNIGCPYCKRKMSAKGGLGKKVKVHFSHIGQSDDCDHRKYYDKKFKGDKQKQKIHEMTVESVIPILENIYKNEINEGYSLDREFYVPPSANEPKISFADIALLDKKKQIVIAFEIQLTKLSVFDLDERTSRYHNKGIEVFWFFGKGCEQEDIVTWSRRTFGQTIFLEMEFYVEEEKYGLPNSKVNTSQTV